MTSCRHLINILVIWVFIFSVKLQLQSVYFSLGKLEKKRMLKSAAVCKEEGKMQVWKDGLPVSVLFRDTLKTKFFLWSLLVKFNVQHIKALKSIQPLFSEDRNHLQKSMNIFNLVNVYKLHWQTCVVLRLESFPIISIFDNQTVNLIK